MPTDNRPTCPSSLDTKPAAVDIQPSPNEGQMVTAARIDLVTVGNMPQQPQPARAGGFPFLPAMGFAALAIGAIALPSILAELNNSKVAELKAQQMTLERQLETAKTDQQQLDQLREEICR